MINYLNPIFSEIRNRKFTSTLFYSFFSGILCYLYLMVNNLFNCDNITYEPCGYGVGITSGRWALELSAKLSNAIWGNYNIPFFNVLLSIILISLSSYVIVMTFDINNIWLCRLIGALTVVFPAICSGMAYTFTIGYYAFAILLSTTGVYLLNKKSIYAFIISVLLFSFSLGIYQAYFPFSISLLILLLIKMCVQDKFKTKEIIIKASRFLSALIIAYGIYFIVLNIALKMTNLSLTEYQGISDMGNLSINSSIFTKIRECYRITILLPLIDYNSISTTRAIKVCLIILYAIAGLSIISFIRKNWKTQKSKILMLILFICVFPIAVNLILITSPSAAIYTLMCIPFISVFYFPIILVENTCALKSIKLRNLSLNKYLSSCAIVVLFVTVSNYTWQGNGNFRTLYFVNKRLVNYYSELYTRVRATQGFSTDKKILFLGRNIEDPTFVLKTGETPFEYGGVQNIVLNDYLESRVKTIKNYLGYSYSEITLDGKEYSMHKSEFLSMKKYPNDGSIKALDNVILVRFE